MRYRLRSPAVALKSSEAEAEGGKVGSYGRYLRRDGYISLCGDFGPNLMDGAVLQDGVYAAIERRGTERPDINVQIQT